VVRLSIGIEDKDDIIADIEQGLAEQYAGTIRRDRIFERH
jgi:hypothetical protein